MSDDSIEVRSWVKRGGMLVNASALEIDDPDHIYNQIVALGKRPEDYGVMHPYSFEFGDLSRDQLIDEIVRLRKELEGWSRADAMGVMGKYK